MKVRKVPFDREFARRVLIGLLAVVLFIPLVLLTMLYELGSTIVESE